jgi:hypothetical protein
VLGTASLLVECISYFGNAGAVDMPSQGRDDKRRRSVIAHQGRQRDLANAATDAAFDAMDNRSAQDFFGKRGLSRSSIAALVASGMQLPEELLFLTEREINEIPGLDAAGLEAIRAYRGRMSRA